MEPLKRNKKTTTKRAMNAKLKETKTKRSIHIIIRKKYNDNNNSNKDKNDRLLIEAKPRSEGLVLGQLPPWAMLSGLLTNDDKRCKERAKQKFG